MLRLDAERFGTAEYYEATRDGERPRIRRRLAWYGLGAGLALAILYIHPAPQSELFLGSGDRARAVIGGLAYGGARDRRRPSRSRGCATTASASRIPRRTRARC